MCCCPECADHRRGLEERAGGPGSLLHVTLQQEHNGRVALRRLLELLQRDLVVVVLIHFAEDLVHPLLWCQTVLVHLHHDHGAHHFVDSLWVRHSEKLVRGLIVM